MVRKRDMVQGTKELFEVLSNVETRDEESILLLSDQYVQLGCDLRDLEGLGQSLSTAINLDNCTLLFTAEVSITYMTVETSDALIKWVSRLPEGITAKHPAIIVVTNIAPARFCILEQLMPDGPDHPFAQTMMAHFKKLRTPLGAVEKYPTALAQHQRFEALGWSNISARSLWELWSSLDFLSSDDRSSLDHVEPFDEWEEFALFASHYILLTADNKIGPPHRKMPSSTPSENQSLNAEVLYSESPNTQGRRRFAASLPIRNPARSGTRVGNFGGMGLNGRLASCDIYSSNDTRNRPFDYFTTAAPSGRMCHTITDLGDVGALLVGGRTSPDQALVDCWVYHKWPRVWERVEDLPRPRYRHSAVKLSDGSVLISPGRANSRSIDSYFMIWNRKSGWRQCTWGTSEKPHSTFGSTFTVTTASDDSMKSALGCGLIAGGISEDGVVQQDDIWEWEVQHSSYDQVSVAGRIVRLSIHNTQMKEHWLMKAYRRSLYHSNASQSSPIPIGTQPLPALALPQLIIRAGLSSLVGL
jgi:tRNA wybutosine-synthesizing protein 4